jgi:hypothetical protein
MLPLPKLTILSILIIALVSLIHQPFIYYVNYFNNYIEQYIEQYIGSQSSCKTSSPITPSPITPTPITPSPNISNCPFPSPDPHPSSLTPEILSSPFLYKAAPQSTSFLQSTTKEGMLQHFGEDFKVTVTSSNSYSENLEVIDLKEVSSIVLAPINF